MYLYNLTLSRASGIQVRPSHPPNTFYHCYVHAASPRRCMRCRDPLGAGAAPFPVGLLPAPYARPARQLALHGSS